MTLLSNAILYVLVYLALMLPSYVLPYVGSNSTVVNALSAASMGKLNPFFWLHLASLAALCVLAWIRSDFNNKKWLPAVPGVALAFDLLPILSAIPFAPTILHAFAIIAGAGGVAISDDANFHKTRKKFIIGIGVVGFCLLMAAVGAFIRPSRAGVAINVKTSEPVFGMPPSVQKVPVQAQNQSAAPIAENGIDRSAMPLDQKSLNPKWLGVWKGDSGVIVEITEKSATFKSIDSDPDVYKWVGLLESEVPGTFGYSGVTTTKVQIIKDYESARLRSRAPGGPATMSKGSFDFVVSQLSDDRYKTIYVSKGGDCGGVDLILEKEKIFQIQNCEYGYDISVFKR